MAPTKGKVLLFECDAKGSIPKTGKNKANTDTTILSFQAPQIHKNILKQ